MSGDEMHMATECSNVVILKPMLKSCINHVTRYHNPLSLPIYQTQIQI